MLARLQAKTGCFWGAQMGGLCKCGSFDLCKQNHYCIFCQEMPRNDPFKCLAPYTKFNTWPPYKLLWELCTQGIPQVQYAVIIWILGRHTNYYGSYVQYVPCRGDWCAFHLDLGTDTAPSGDKHSPPPVTPLSPPWFVLSYT